MRGKNADSPTAGALALVVVFLIGQAGCQQIGIVNLSPDKVIGFEEVKPILQARCLPCHQGDYLGATVPDFRTSEALLGQGGPAPLVVPGEPESSRLLQVVYLEEESGEVMPPLGHGLSLEEKNRIGEWIRQGAPWPEGEVLQSAPVADTTSR